MKWILISLLTASFAEARENEEIQMENHSNIQLVRDLLEGTLDPQNLSSYDRFFAENIRMHGPFQGYEEDCSLSLCKEFDAWLAKTFKKEQMDFQEIFTHEDKVIVYWVLNCIHNQTGKKHTVSGTSMYRVDNQKITEVWQSWDASALALVLGNDPNFSSPQAFLEGMKTDPVTLFGLEEYRRQLDSLSDREYECLQHVLLGKTAKEIGEYLHLSPRTIESYLESLREKLSCHSKRELFSRAQLFSKLRLMRK